MSHSRSCLQEYNSRPWEEPLFSLEFQCWLCHSCWIQPLYLSWCRLPDVLQLPGQLSAWNCAYLAAWRSHQCGVAIVQIIHELIPFSLLSSELMIKHMSVFAVSCCSLGFWPSSIHFPSTASRILPYCLSSPQVLLYHHLSLHSHF